MTLKVLYTLVILSIMVATSSAISAVLPSWLPLGTPILHSYVVAISASSSTNTNIIAYGASDVSPDDTTTRILSWNGTSWLLIGQHTPQYAQPYEHFSLKVRDESLNLGLVINPSDSAAAGLSSVLRNVSSKISDGFEGCYAFQGVVYDYDVAKDGSIRVAVTPDNTTLGIMSYSASGYSSYPAGDAWSNLTVVVSNSVAITAIAVARAHDETLLVVWTDNSGHLELGLTTLTSSTMWYSYGAPFSKSTSLSVGTSPSIAWAGNVTCIAAYTNIGDLIGTCSRDLDGNFIDTIILLSQMNTNFTPGIAARVLPDGSVRVIFTAVTAETGNVIQSTTCLIANFGLPLCVPTSLTPLSFESNINDFSMHGTPNTDPVLAVSIGPADGTGDALVVFSIPLA